MSPTSFFVGESDDLTYRDYAPLMAEALGTNANAVTTADDTQDSGSSRNWRSRWRGPGQLDGGVH